MEPVKLAREQHNSNMADFVLSTCSVGGHHNEVNLTSPVSKEIG